MFGPAFTAPPSSVSPPRPRPDMRSFRAYGPRSDVAFGDSFPSGITQRSKYGVLLPLTPVKSTLSSEFLSVRLQPKRNPGHPGRSAPPVSSSSALLRSPPPPPSTAAGASQTRRCLQPQPASPRGPRGEEGTGVCSAPVEQDPAFLRGRPVQGPARAPVRAGVQPEFHVHTQASDR